MIKKILKENYGYLILLVVLVFLFFFCEKYFYAEVLSFDNKVIEFFSNYVVNDFLTVCMRVITFLGEAVSLIFILVMFFIFMKNKRLPFVMTCNLIFAHLVNTLLKNIFMRERPLVSLITKPSSFSFPSGHAMCSIAFFGFIIYLIFVNEKNKVFKWFSSVFLGLLIFLIGVSRIYLNVHYFSDVLVGFVLGFICLCMFINIYKRNVIK